MFWFNIAAQSIWCIYGLYILGLGCFFVHSIELKLLSADLWWIWSRTNSKCFSCSSPCCSNAWWSKSCCQGPKCWYCYKLGVENFTKLIGLSFWLIAGSAHTYDGYCCSRLCNCGVDSEHIASIFSFLWLQVRNILLFHQVSWTRYIFFPERVFSFIITGNTHEPVRRMVQKSVDIVPYYYFSPGEY